MFAVIKTVIFSKVSLLTMTIRCCGLTSITFRRHDVV